MNFSFPKSRCEYSRVLAVTALSFALLALSGCDAVERIRDKNRVEPLTDFSKRGSVSKLEFKTTSALQAGKRALWSLKVLWRVPPEGASEYIRDFQFIDEHVFHLYIVSQDRRFFSHLLPEPRDYGHFLVETSLPRVGKYLLLSEYVPHKSLPELKRFSISVAPAPGGANVPLPPAPPLLSSAGKPIESAAVLTQLDIAGNPKLDDSGALESAPSPYAVTLQANAPLIANADVKFHATAKNATAKNADGSAPKLQIYLGGAGFFSALSRDGESFVRGAAQKFSPATREYSPEMARAGTDFTMRFPRAGRYTLWTEFGLERAKIVAPFEIEIAPGKTKAQPAATAARPMATR